MPIIQQTPLVRTVDSGTTPIDFTFASPTTDGSTLFLVVANYDSTIATSVIDVDAHPSWSLVGSFPIGINRGYIYKCSNINSSGSANPYIRLTPGSASDQYWTGMGVEVSEDCTVDNVTTGTGGTTLSLTATCSTSNSFAVSITVAQSGSDDCNFAVTAGTQLYAEDFSNLYTGSQGVYSYTTAASVTHTHTAAVSVAGLIASFSIPGSSGPTEYTITPAGGISLSGSPSLVREMALVPDGGVTLGGTATVAFNKSYTITPSGGAVFSGAPPTIRNRAIIPSGGFSLGGAVSLTHEGTLVPSGGITLAGTGNISFTPNASSELIITPSGGISYSGISDVIRERQLQPSGGIILTGQVQFQREASFIPNGGITFNGGSSFIREQILSPSGGVTFGGNGGMFFVPDGVISADGLFKMDRMNFKLSKAMGL